MSLRKISEDDLLSILDWRNSPEVRQHMYSTHIITEAEHQSWYKRMKLDPQSIWYIHEDEHGKPDGVVYFTDYSKDNQNSFWGFYADPAAPKGTGSQLGIEALDEAFKVLNLHKLNAEVLASNLPSLGLHKKLGFSKEGVFRDFHYDGTQYIDVIRLGILSSEWANIRTTFKKALSVRKVK